MNPIVSLEGRTIVVTGAGQGIGKAIVETAVALGANVVAVDLNGETLGAVAAAQPEGRVLAEAVNACEAGDNKGCPLIDSLSSGGPDRAPGRPNL